MRNRGFFWSITAIIAIACIYQLSFTFFSNGTENEAEQEAQEIVDGLFANKTAENDSIALPNGTVVYTDDIEAKGKAKAAYINSILKAKGEEYSDDKEKSIALGLDLKGGMSVTLQLSMPELVENLAVSKKSPRFSKPYKVAVAEYDKGVSQDFIELFARAYKVENGDTPLIKAFASRKVLEELNPKSTDEEVLAYLRSQSDNALDGVENIMEKRINQFGVASPKITKDVTANRLYIELPGVKDKETVRKKLQSTANLEFYEAISASQLSNFIISLGVNEKEESLDDLVDTVKDSTDTTTATTDVLDDLAEEDDKPEAEIDVAFFNMFRINGDFQQGLRNSAVIGYVSSPEDTLKINKMIAAKSADLNQEINFVWDAEGDDYLNYEGNDNDTIYYGLYALKIPTTGKARISGDMIDDAYAGFNIESNSHTVNLSMTSIGSEEWAKMTKELEPKLSQFGSEIYSFAAITMDNKVYSAPRIINAIEGGNTEISGNFNQSSATDLANLLNGGALPAPCHIVEESIVGPTIGAENSRSGILSFAFALVLVLLYMIFYYGKAGVVANVALVANILFIVGSLATFGAVLTLAGIAGIVLTIGMSVDANVLIYERIREEIADGKSVKVAVKDGYKKALAAILDANVTTLLTAVVLKSFGTGPIESFATTLIIGIFTSVFAAVVITRLIFEWQLAKGKNLSFSTKITENWFKNLNFQFVKNRKKYYLLSGALVVLGLAAIFGKGLKQSVEFTGGRNYEVAFEERTVNGNKEAITVTAASQIDVLETQLRAALVEADGSKASVEVKKIGTDYRIQVATDYRKNEAMAGNEVEAEILKVLGQNVELGAPSVKNSRSVASTVSEELKTSSLVSIIFSLVIVFIYILIRFGNWQYGLGALLAMAHDVIIVLGVFAAFHGIMPFNMEIDQAFIAAILTVVGYSINDTVVVFDRIREYLAKHRNNDRKEVINHALNSTLSRTINTSLSTFVVLLTIFIFDSGAIKGFVFALMIGVIVGTYSSICIATPSIIDFVKDKVGKKKEEGHNAVEA